MAYLVEQAGGTGLCGRNEKILDITIKDLHQRTPFFAGSSKEVEKIIDFMNV
jgi:fructose-1,6-bisphosphatase I